MISKLQWLFFQPPSAPTCLAPTALLGMMIFIMLRGKPSSLHGSLIILISLATVKNKQLRVPHYFFYSSWLTCNLAVKMCQEAGINVENQNVIFLKLLQNQYKDYS